MNRGSRNLPLFFLLKGLEIIVKVFYNINKSQERSKLLFYEVYEEEVIMANLVDLIEQFIKDSFKDMNSEIIEIQRNEMANRFRCAPSQINYVLTTRFTIEKGYFIESRRGGGGYIRIKKLKISENDFLKDIIEYIGDSLSSSDARDIICRLMEEDILSEREAEILSSVINRNCLLISLPGRDRLRARIMRTAISTIMDLEARKGGNN